MSGREIVLRNVFKALHDVPGTEAPTDVPVPRNYRSSHAGGDLIGLFERRAADYRATTWRSTAEGLADAVSWMLALRKVRKLLVPPGLPEGFVARTQCEIRWDRPAHGLAYLEDADGVLTTCALAIAETATIVLDGGPGQGRRALTLVPDYHLCVIPADRLIGDVPEAFARLDPNRPLTFISGPSVTRAIDDDVVEGVHGPRTLDVILVEDIDRLTGPG